MKFSLSTLLFVLIALSSSAQEANRPVLVEHFTNTYCSICASRNPPLYAVMEEFGNSLHHISYFPSQPYDQCPLYNYNTAGNGARQNFYRILATPTLFVNGLPASSRADGFRDVINAQISQTARVLVEVEETSGSSRDVNVTLTGLTSGEISDFRLFVALVERNLEFAADNGETEHFNVFRKMLTANEGDQINVPAQGESTIFNFTTNVEPAVSLEEAYILAYVQDLVSGEILGSGTRFDEAITDVETVAPTQVGLALFPNPVHEHLEIRADQADISHVQIRNLFGQTMYDSKFVIGTKAIEVDLQNWPAGTYLVSAYTRNNQVATMRIAKQ